MKWAVPVIVVALSACILAGSLGFQDTVKATTEYDTVLSDLAPIADAGPVTESVNYNPLTNVTGWGANVGFDTQSAASLYKFETDLIWESGTSSAMSSAGVWVLEPELYVDTTLYLWQWSNGDYISSTAPGNVIGGWSGEKTATYGVITQYIRSSISARIIGTGTEYSYARDLVTFNLPNDTVVTPADAANGGVLAVRTAPGSGWTFTLDDRTETLTERAVMYLGGYEVLDFDVYYKDGLFYRILSYDETGRPQLDSSQTFVMFLLSDSLTANFGYSHMAGSTVSYIKPYTPAKLMNASGSTWRNGYSNTMVKILADAKGLTFSINDYLAPDEGLEDTQDPAYLTWMNSGTGMILITLDANGPNYWQGVTSYSSTKDYTVAEYRYTFLSPYNNIHEPIESLWFYYNGAGTHRVAIVDTWIPQDSNGVLWDDATFNIDTIFPTLWANDNLRVKFNSFVTTGSGLTINGTTYPVADGKITISDKTFKLAGSSIEWTPAGDTTLEAPNGDRYDLGTRTGGFTLNGVWYGVLSMDTFETIQAPAKEAVFGMVPDISWLAWVFVGVLVVGTVGVLATGRQLDTMDILALGLMGVVGVVVAVI